MLFNFHIHIVSLAAQEELAVAQLASPLAYYFISPDFFPSLPFAPSSTVHCTMFCLTHPRTYTCMHTYYLYRLIPHLAWNGFISIGASFGNRNSDRDDRSCPEEEEVRPWCEVVM
jgi:hypothetical protein